MNPKLFQQNVKDQRTRRAIFGDQKRPPVIVGRLGGSSVAVLVACLSRMEDFSSDAGA